MCDTQVGYNRINIEFNTANSMTYCALWRMQAADWRTRVQFPPPPPITKPQPDRVGVFYWPFDFGMKTRSGFSRTTKW